MGKSELDIYQEDDDAGRFLQVLELFDLTQHVSHSTHKYGNTLDLIITRANDDLVGRCFVHDPLISDHLAVHVSLRLAKLPPERRTMSYCRIRAIDFYEFCCDLENSSLVRDAETTDLSDFVNKYNNTLKSLSHFGLPPHGTTTKFYLRTDVVELWSDVGVPQNSSVIVLDSKSRAAR